MFGYTGDDLQNFWGLVGLAFAFGGLSMAVTGRAKYPFWGFAAITLLTAFFWRYVEQTAPAVAASVVTVTTSPHTWFNIVLLGLGVLLFRQGLERASSRKPIEPETSLAQVQAPPLPPKSVREQLGSWAHVDRFRVDEAAVLWAGKLPGTSFLLRTPEIAGAERLIVSELKNKLDTNETTMHLVGDYSHAYVSRTDLLALAVRKGLRPLFLYPDG